MFIHGHTTVSQSEGAMCSDVYLRRSSRLKQKIETSQQQAQTRSHQQLPSPYPSCSPTVHKAVRKRSLEIEVAKNADRDSKRLRTAQIDHPPPSPPPRDPVAYWVAKRRSPTVVIIRAENASCLWRMPLASHATFSRTPAPEKVLPRRAVLQRRFVRQAFSA